MHLDFRVEQHRRIVNAQLSFLSTFATELRCIAWLEAHEFVYIVFFLFRSFLLYKSEIP